MSAAASLQTQAAKSQALSNSQHASLLLQRKCACGSPTASLTGQCAECQSKKRLQTRLAIGASNDPLELEADRVADQVMAAPRKPAVNGPTLRIQRFAGHPTGKNGTAPASIDRVVATSGRADGVLQRDGPPPEKDEAPFRVPSEGSADAALGPATAAAPASVCNPKGLKRPDFLKEPNTSMDDFGLTLLVASNATVPAVSTQPVKGRGVRIEPTTAALPTIPSVYTGVDTFTEGFAHFLGQGGGACSSGKKPIRWSITATGAAKIAEGEQDHCSDFQLAFDLSLKRYADAVNTLAGKRIFPTQAAAERAVTRVTGAAPADWFDAFVCLSRKTKLRDTNGWHKPRPIMREPRIDENCEVVHALIIGASLPEVGQTKHPSSDIIKDCGEAGKAAGKGAASGKVEAPGPLNGPWEPWGPDEEADTLMQRRANPDATALNRSDERAADLVDRVLSAPGQALNDTVRGFMEERFGRDFGDVRVHLDDQAAQSARSVGAFAYTVDRHVVFDQGRYEPHSPVGQRLLAHELAHVVQQSRGGTAIDADTRADAAADQVVQRHRVSPHSLGGAPLALQAKPDDAPAILPPVTSLNQTLASVELGAGEATTKDNPKLMQIADSYKASAGLGGAASVHLSAYLPSSVQNNSAQETTERGKLNARMRTIRDVLKALGVPEDAIDLSPATAYSTSAHGQVLVDVSKPTAPNPLLTPTLAPLGVTPPASAPGTQSGSALPSLDLNLNFGPVTVSLPKEVRAKLPIAFRSGKSLVIDLSYEVPAKFALKITLDGTPFLRVSLKAGTEIDAKAAAVTGSVGLQIDTVATVCNAPDPGETREKIKSAGDKLNKAVQEFSAASGTDKLDKAVDIAGAIGEIYDAVDKAKSKCKPVPRASFELGYKHLLSPGSQADPTKLPPLDYAGVTATFHF
jgi:hypothetical protein